MKTKFKGKLSFDAFKKAGVNIVTAGEIEVHLNQSTNKKRPVLKTNYKKFKQPKAEAINEQTIESN